MDATKTMRIERSEDGVNWGPVDYETAVRRLSGAYRSMGKLFEVMRDGQVVRTAFAMYRMAPPESH